MEIISKGGERYNTVFLFSCSADMEKGADEQTLSAEIDGDCGNYLAETYNLLCSDAKRLKIMALFHCISNYSLNTP